MKGTMPTTEDSRFKIVARNRKIIVKSLDNDFRCVFKR